jgi:hypothetical protein
VNKRETRKREAAPEDQRDSFTFDNLMDQATPPLAGKTHPRDAMDEAVPTLDDSDRVFLHHPNQPIGEGFSYDPVSADAAADMAGDLGAEFLEGATRGRDMSDMILSEDERNEETPFIVEDLDLMDDETTESDEPEDLEDAEFIR